MSEKILFVDDEKNILAAIRRQLRGRFTIDTAVGAAEGLQMLGSGGPYAVVVSDLRMPGMDGIAFLSHVMERSPDTVRMMLSGNADMQSALAAINEGNIFQFLTKPCSREMLTNALQQGLRQYRLVTAEKELLDRTLKGSIKVLSEVLSLVNPEAFGRSDRIKRHVLEIVETLKVPNRWEIETAVLLSQVGCVIIPEAVLKKVYYGEELTGEESQLFDMHPMVAYDLICNIPRMKEIARIIHYQEKHFDGSGIPFDGTAGRKIPLGGRILKVVLDYDALETCGIPTQEALSEMKGRTGWYDPDLLKIFEKLFGMKERYLSFSRPLAELTAGMILKEDLKSKSGVLLLSRGVEINDIMLTRLLVYVRNAPICEPVKVLVPREIVPVDENAETDANRGILEE